MAYDSKNLSVLAYANGFTLWHYCTADSVEDVVQRGYFDDGAGMLRSDDFILVNAGNGSTVRAVSQNITGSINTVGLSV